MGNYSTFFNESDDLEREIKRAPVAPATVGADPEEGDAIQFDANLELIAAPNSTTVGADGEVTIDGSEIMLGDGVTVQTEVTSLEASSPLLSASFDNGPDTGSYNNSAGNSMLLLGPGDAINAINTILTAGGTPYIVISASSTLAGAVWTTPTTELFDSDINEVFQTGGVIRVTGNDRAVNNTDQPGEANRIVSVTPFPQTSFSTVVLEHPIDFGASTQNTFGSQRAVLIFGGARVPDPIITIGGGLEVGGELTVGGDAISPIILNPTANAVPLRLTATSFGDSPITVTGTTTEVEDDLTVTGTATITGGISREAGGSTTDGVRFWTGTIAQYNAFPDPDPNTLYFTT